MALTEQPLPYGLRDVKLTPYTGSGDALGTPQDLPASRTLTFSESEDFEELRGDDGVVTARGSGPNAEWELEQGGISFECFKILTGATLSETGTTPAQSKMIRRKSTDTRPFFKVEGQAMSDSGGDFHVVLYKCRATGDITGELTDGAFWLTGASGRIFPVTVDTDDNVLYDFIQNESETAIDDGS